MDIKMVMTEEDVNFLIEKYDLEEILSRSTL